MKLSKIAILALRGCPRRTKQKIADELSMSLNTFYRLINENERDGDLTKATALKTIAGVTGLDDSQILEESAESVSK